jgi:hypothetical protein
MSNLMSCRSLKDQSSPSSVSPQSFPQFLQQRDARAIERGPGSGAAICIFMQELVRVQFVVIVIEVTVFTQIGPA